MTDPNQRRNVLVVAYYFPPMGLSGVQRTLKFVKYLPQFGWQPTVVTVTPTGYFAEDYSLLAELTPYNIDIIRIGSLDPNRLFRKKGVVQLPSESTRKLFTFLSDLFFIPDNKKMWKNKVLRTMNSLLKKQSFHIIFATAPPFTDFLIGKALHERYHIPLVVDYRDVWHEYPYKYYPTPLHKYLNYRLERDVLRASSAVITTNRRVKELVLKRYKFLHYNDVKIIPQGFDPADFNDAKKTKKREPRTKMRIAHAGTFYGDRTPLYFLKGVKQAIKSQPNLKGRLAIDFIGAFRSADKNLITSLGLDELVHIHGYLDHQQCVEKLLEADLLWLTLGNDLQSPGKVYEYLAARKPILACVPDGFVRQTLQEAGATTVVEPTDVKGITKTILALFEQYRRGTLPRPREEVVERYNRITLTEELAKTFGFLTES